MIPPTGRRPVLFLLFSVLVKRISLYYLSRFYIPYFELEGVLYPLRLLFTFHGKVERVIISSLHTDTRRPSSSLFSPTTTTVRNVLQVGETPRLTVFYRLDLNSEEP